MSETRAQQAAFEMLCMKALDDELNTEEKNEFNRLIQESLEFRQEYEAMKKVREITREMQFGTPSDAVWDNYWTCIYNRIERGIGWIILTAGVVLLSTWGTFQLISSLIFNQHVALIVKAGVLLVILGFFILAVSAIRERCFMGRRDPYKEIKR